MKYPVQKLVFASTLACLGAQLHAANLNNGDILLINPGVVVTDSLGNVTNITGSWFGMDVGGDSKIQVSEQTALSQGTNGIVIGAVTMPGNYHLGTPLPSDTGPVVDSWAFNSNTGTNYNTIAITGGTTGLNFSGWDVAWSTTPSFGMGTGAWQPLNCAARAMVCTTYTNGVAQFTWNGVYGSSYTLDYTATVPSGGFAGTKYAIHLEGTVLAAGAVTVSAQSPGDAATNVAINSTVQLQFSAAMQPATINNTSIVVAPTAGGAAVNCTWTTSDNLTFTCTPSAALAVGTQYTITVNSGARTAAANASVTGAPKTFSFTTTAAPTVSSVSPASNATSVSLGATIIATFAAAVDPATVNAATFKVVPTAGGTAVACTFSNSASKIFVCTPTAPLAANTDYTVQLTTGIKDPTGISMTAPYTWAFKTTTGLARKLVPGDVLTICPGSRFGMEQNPGVITVTSLDMANGIKIGVAQPALGSHTGAPNGSETPGIDKPWNFFNNTGMHFTATPVTSIDGSTLDFSGWRVTWNAIPSINMGGAPANFPQDTSKASISWDGTDGGAYTLDYAAHVPLGDPSGFGGVPYTLHLVGRVNTPTVQAPCEVKPTTAEGVEITANKGTVVPSSITSTLPAGADLAAAGLSEAGRPSNLDFYLYRLMRYTITGLAADGSDEVTITLIFPSDIPAGSKLYKVSSTGFTLIADAVFSGRNATFKIKDNGPFDENKTNGVISDPVALGTPLPALQASGGSGGGCTIGTAPGQNEAMFGLLLLLAGIGRLWSVFRSGRYKS